ncbi:glycerophosphoryl diester phosphodiesterase membrane domain-containing protein [Alteraurantiacibacter aquimixticola]|uniref:DUF7847 domain-containing protein n=1 Tax=Alteraurantiacibacter aquimixticola TaxID=2489173 RepID=A0A4T3F380_9SPHN|nr:glycerophosphoryl diester phosphodiesterase membrane domain-containing protein [Alteraurantiacibacter aquimixticola]TIX51191.1 hypothetical protein E5222_01595 [Alteraurantiacibacter aquimixticola]
MNFDMNRTWSQGVALVQANWQLLAVIAGIFLLIPGMLMYVAFPDLMTGLQGNPDPDRLAAMFGEVAGSLVIYVIFAVIFQMIGYTAMIALMGADRPTVGEALRLGAQCLPTLIGVLLLMILAYIAIGIALVIVTGLVSAVVGLIGGGALAAVLGVIIAIAMMVVMLYVSVRFCLTTPVVALEGQRNPVAAVKRSWTLTGSHSRRIFGFFALLFIAYLVISLLIGAVAGLLASAFGGGSATNIVLGLTNGAMGAVVAMILCGLLVSMYQQLAGSGSESLSKTFD